VELRFLKQIVKKKLVVKKLKFLYNSIVFLNKLILQGIPMERPVSGGVFNERI